MTRSPYFILICLFFFAVITWYKDNRPLTSTASISFLNRGQIVEIEGAQISDTGIYKCTVVNAAGIAELFYSLQVHGKYYLVKRQSGGGSGGGIPFFISSGLLKFYCMNLTSSRYLLK